jgi:hypothetical protein
MEPTHGVDSNVSWATRQQLFAGKIRTRQMGPAVTPIYLHPGSQDYWVSITPLRLDLTDEKDLARAQSLARTPPVSAAKKG